jgi:predicted hotdog family 3-hydroxylacyl-ACP dehydratase
MLDIEIDTLVPHRRPLRLVDAVVTVSGDAAITAATVTPAWPTYRDGAVSSLVLIELVAQTAAVVGGYKALTDPSDTRPHKGMLVGIKQADFKLDTIPCDTRIVTWATTRLLLENFREIEGFSSIDDQVIGEMILQGVQSD